MKALKFIGYTVLALILIIIVLGLIAPKDFDMKRSTVINAQPDVIYRNVSTFEGFNKWNPFSKMDLEQKTKVEGTDGTVGAKYSWEGKKTGKGDMTTAKLEENKSAQYDMTFYTPMGEMKSESDMFIEPAEGGQKVTWEFKGRSPFPWNIMSLFSSMDKSMGPVFDDGLRSLKELSESAPAMAATYQVQETDWTAKTCLATAKKKLSASEIGGFMGQNYPKIATEIGKAGGKPGIPLAVYYSWDEKAMNGELVAAIPYEGVKGGTIKSKDFSNLELPATKAYKVDYYGWYDKMMPAYAALNAKINGMGIQHPDLTIEEYVSDPMSEKDTSKIHTIIYYVVKQPMARK